LAIGRSRISRRTRGIAHLRRKVAKHWLVVLAARTLASIVLMIVAQLIKSWH
jgi:hypothetical protein